MLPVLTDVDTAAEAELIAAEVPGSRFAARLAAILSARPVLATLNS
jgi:hypothetical protein